MQHAAYTNDKGALHTSLMHPPTTPHIHGIFISWSLCKQ